MDIKGQISPKSSQIGPNWAKFEQLSMPKNYQKVKKIKIPAMYLFNTTQCPPWLIIPPQVLWLSTFPPTCHKRIKDYVVIVCCITIFINFHFNFLRVIESPS